jgi:methionyl-tRNA formyltransferase
VAYRVGFLGLPLAALALEADGHEVGFAALSPVPAPGRRRLAARIGAGRILDAGEAPAERLAEQIGARLAAGPPELLVSWFWTRRIPAGWLAFPRDGAINAHPSLLPRHRGPDPYFWAIDAGDLATGVTIHRISAELDAGEIIAQRAMPVGERDAWQLARALDRPALALLRQVVGAFRRGAVPPGVPQDERAASWAPRPSGELLGVDWRWPTERILRRIRALSPDPGLALAIGGVPVFVTRAAPTAAPARSFVAALEPGEAAAIDGAAVVRTGDAAVVLQRATVGLGASLPAATELDADGIARLLRARR